MRALACLLLAWTLAVAGASGGGGRHSWQGRPPRVTVGPAAWRALRPEPPEEHFPQSGDCPVPAGWPFANKSRLRVSNGFKAREGDFPSAVGVKFQKRDLSGELVCSGVLLSARTVLTAAHCLNGSHSVHVSGSLHSPFRWQEAGVVPVPALKFCICPYYKADLNHPFDLGVIVLERPLELGPNLQPACLTSTESDYGKRLWVAGYGAVDTTFEGGEPRLQMADSLMFTAMKATQCSDFEENWSHTCTEQEFPDAPTDSCPGDSGGGLYTVESGSLVLHAITSHGPPMCIRGRKGTAVNTAINHYAPSIPDFAKRCITNVYLPPDDHPDPIGRDQVAPDGFVTRYLRPARRQLARRP